MTLIYLISWVEVFSELQKNQLAIFTNRHNQSQVLLKPISIFSCIMAAKTQEVEADPKAYIEFWLFLIRQNIYMRMPGQSGPRGMS